jgi:hypothetical protein
LLHAAIPSMALLYGHNPLDTLHERVGDEFDDGGVNALATMSLRRALRFF